MDNFDTNTGDKHGYQEDWKSGSNIDFQCFCRYSLILGLNFKATIVYQQKDLLVGTIFF